jgi:hypothetical protein
VALRLAIIDKLQILALTRPRALIVVNSVLDGLLDKNLGFLDGSLDDDLTEPSDPPETE